MEISNTVVHTVKDREIIKLAEQCCRVVLQHNVEKLLGSDKHIDLEEFNNEFSKQVKNFHITITLRYPKLTKILDALVDNQHDYYNMIIHPLAHLNPRR